jgi:hypothetical protein
MLYANISILTFVCILFLTWIGKVRMLQTCRYNQILHFSLWQMFHLMCMPLAELSVKLKYTIVKDLQRLMGKVLINKSYKIILGGGFVTNLYRYLRKKIKISFYIHVYMSKYATSIKQFIKQIFV